MYTFYIKFSTYVKSWNNTKLVSKDSQKNSYPHVVDKIVNNLSETQYIVNKYFFVVFVFYLDNRISESEASYIYWLKLVIKL